MSEFSWRRAWPAYVSMLVFAVLFFGGIWLMLASHWTGYAPGFVISVGSQLIAYAALFLLTSVQKRWEAGK